MNWHRYWSDCAAPTVLWLSIPSFYSQSIARIADPAAPAALLLRRVNPKCPISCRDAIQEMLTDWDVSIEEVPFYLAEQFGVPKVLATLDEIGSTVSDETQTTLLGTVRYWLRGYQEMQAASAHHDAKPQG
jgi:hypothetical protein